MTYVSPACQWLLLHAPEDITGANIFEIVTHDCHPLLRKMISENLSRPVHAQHAGKELSPDQHGTSDDMDRSDSDDGAGDFEQTGNSTERLHQRYRQSHAAMKSGNNGGNCKDGRRRLSTSVVERPNMLRLIRGDETTVWCESRLSVRTAKSDGSHSNPLPLEIILTLRTVSEGSKTQHGLASVERQVVEAAVDADEYVEADDDGYQCEAEEDSNNSGSGNDYGNARKRLVIVGSGRSAKKRSNSGQEPPVSASEVTQGREERSLSKKRQRASNISRMEDMISVAQKAGVRGDRSSRSRSSSRKGIEEDSSTGGDTGGSTTQEGSGSCSNEADSNGEGSNNGSSSNKWDRCDDENDFKRSRRVGDCCGSEDSGSLDEGSSGNGGDLGEEVQSAVHSLILMGGNFGDEGQ